MHKSERCQSGRESPRRGQVDVLDVRIGPGADVISGGRDNHEVVAVAPDELTRARTDGRLPRARRAIRELYTPMSFAIAEDVSGDG